MIGSDRTPDVRPRDRMSISEIVPLGSRKSRFFRSPLFVFGALTATVPALLYALNQSLVQQTTVPGAMEVFKEIAAVVTIYALLSTLIAVLVHSRSRRGLLYFAFPVAVVLFILVTPLKGLFFYAFGELAGNSSGHGKTFGAAFVEQLLSAGLMEELMKGLAPLAGAVLTWRGLRNARGWSATLHEALRVRSPLDGLLLGLGAGAGFVFYEALLYMEADTIRYLRASQGNLAGAFYVGLTSLLPRVFEGLTGHMAYAGTFGYFIGLAAVRRRGWAVLLLPMGWLTAASLHALWNSVAVVSSALQFVVPIVTMVVFLACLVKARQLEAGLFGYDSSLVTPGAHAAAVPPLPRVAPVWTAAVPTAVDPAPRFDLSSRDPAPTVPPPFAPLPLHQAAVSVPAVPPPFTSVLSPARDVPPPFAPPVPPPAATGPAPYSPPETLALSVAGTRIALGRGARIDLGAVPALAGRGAGIVGEVTVNPQRPDVLGLKNLGLLPWRARLHDGDVRTVEPQRNVQLVAGVRLTFGNDVEGEVVLQASRQTCS